MHLIFYGSGFPIVCKQHLPNKTVEAAMGLRTLRRETGKKAVNAKHRAETPRPRRGATTSTHPDPEQGNDSLSSPKVRTGIVSVNGRDIEVMHCRRP